MTDNITPESILIQGSSKPSSSKYTIAIPTYKRADLLKEAIDSAINQDTDILYDILVVDNNPERGDQTEMLLKEYFGVSNLTYYKNKENLGMTGNWNMLYLLSKSDYTVMLHDDDKLYGDFIEKIDKFLGLLQNPDVIFPPYDLSNRKKISTLKYKAHKLNLDEFILDNAVGAPLGMTIKTQIPEELGFFSKKYWESLDEDFYIKCLKNKKNCYRITGPAIAEYRWSDFNTSNNKNVQKAFIINQMFYSLDIIRQKNSLFRFFWLNGLWFGIDRLSQKLHYTDFKFNQNFNSITLRSKILKKIIYKLCSYYIRLIKKNNCKLLDC